MLKVALHPSALFFTVLVNVYLKKGWFGYMNYDIQPGSIIDSRALSWVEGDDWELGIWCLLFGLGRMCKKWLGGGEGCE